MAELIIHQDKIPDNQELIKLCPFGAMEEKDGKVTISAACKMCRLCVRKGPKGAVEYVEDAVKPSIDKSAWKGIAVYVDQWMERCIRLHWSFLEKQENFPR